MQKLAEEEIKPPKTNIENVPIIRVAGVLLWVWADPVIKKRLRA